MRMETDGAAMRLVCGNIGQVSLKNGELEVQAVPGAVTVLQTLDTVPLGLYKNGVLINALESGSFTLRGTNGEPVYAACYEKTGETDELAALQICAEGTELSVGSRVYKIKLFAWDGMEPIAQWEIQK